MAKKIFRVYNGGVTAESGWFNSSIITSDNLDSIKTDNESVATSIPSPFARIDLVKSAFRWVTNHGINGDTAHHKLASDALDVGQLFFLSHMYPEIEIVEWNPISRFRSLEESSNKIHVEFIKTLRTYWEQDGEVYNFSDVDRLFFILYNKQLVGGTSPATLFFATPDANDSKLNMNIQRGSDILLDNIYASLAEREWSYIEYIFALSKTSNFRHFFASPGHDELYYYLEEVKKELTHEQRRILDSQNEHSINDYEKCHVTGSESNYCNVLGIQLGLKKQDLSQIATESDFVINSNLSPDKPLVLPYDNFSPTWAYTTQDVKWDKEQMRNMVLEKNENIRDSILPVQGDKYPWLSIGNFLEDKIIELPYPIDTSKFELCGAKKYLLPLTGIFFKYFSPNDVSRLLKLSELAGGGVEVRLEIPVKGGKILYKRIYNQGKKVKPLIHIALFPYVKVDFDLKYTIGIIDGDFENNSNNDTNATFYLKGEQIIGSNPVIRSPGGKMLKSFYKSIDKPFDCIRLAFNSNSCFLIPKMPKYQPGYDGLNFAIDFGTTNTHIEYNKSGTSEVALGNDNQRNFWASLLDRSQKVSTEYSTNELLFDQEIIPYSFGSKDYSFPLRTALVENKDIDYNKERELFKHLNNFFLYEKVKNQDHLEIKTELKWSNYNLTEDRKRVESYIEYLLTIVYYKSLLLNSSLSKTKITWFYPISMTGFQQGVLEDVWKNAYNKIFASNANPQNLKKMPESIAPFFYYHNKKGVLGLSVSIDIGGGSSDVSIFDQNTAKIISSFRFAGGSIFGDGYGGSPSVNGYVSKFKENASKYLQSNDKNKHQILNIILETKEDSSDFSSFLFSLEKESKGLFNYTALIKEEMNIKLSILVFYSAVGYYIAQLLKGEGYSVPVNFLFSGTGSKSLSIIDSSSDLQNISKLLKYIIEKVINKDAEHDIKTNLSPIPKEITCKGGLLKSSESNASVKFWLGGFGDPEWEQIVDTSSVSNVPVYKDLKPDCAKSILMAINEFYKLFDDYFSNVKIDDVFGISLNAYATFKEMRNDQLNDFLEKGIEIKTQHSNLDAPIEETLFFYPLVGVLNKLSFELSQKNV